MSLRRVVTLLFPLTEANGNPLFSSSDQDAELVVRIYEKDGHVEWPISASMRQGR